jgi:ABC-type branched-subunit amino acid transport system permease subunit
MLHAMYQRNVKARTQFFVEWMALDLIRDVEGQVVGVTAMEMETGEIVIFHAKAVLFATGCSGLLALVTGMLAIRRQGIYFAMITLAFSQMVFFFYLQTPFTGGEDGIQSVPRGKLFGVFDLSENSAMYMFVLAIFLAGAIVSLSFSRNLLLQYVPSAYTSGGVVSWTGAAILGAATVVLTNLLNTFLHNFL